MDLSHLSDEELHALAEQEDVQQPTLATSQQPAINKPQHPEVGDLEAIARGAIHGIPGGDLAAAGIASLLDNSPQTFGERWHKNKAAWEQSNQYAKADSPYLFGGAEMASDIASFIATPGGAGITKLAAWSVGKEVASLPDQSLGEAVIKGAKNTVIGAVGGAVLGKASKAVSEALENSAINNTIHWITDGKFDSINTLVDSAKKYFPAPSNSDSIKKLMTFAEGLTEDLTSNGKRILTPDATTESAFRSSEAALKKAGEVYNTILGDVKSAIKPAEIYAQMDTVLGNPRITSAIAAKEKLLNELKPSLFEITRAAEYHSNGTLKSAAEWSPKPEISLNTLQDIKNNLGDIMKGEYDSSSGIGKMREKISNVIKSTLAMPGNEELAAKWDTHNITYGVLKDINNALADKGNPGIGNSIFSTVKNYLSLRGDAAGSGILLHALGAPVATSIGVSVAIKHALSSGEALSPKLSDGLMKLSNYMAKVPDSPLALRVVGAIAGNSTMFHDQVMSSISELNLQQQPIERNNIDLKNRSDDVLQVMQARDPQAAQAMRDAIRSGNEDAIAAAAEQLSKHPEAQKLIKPGLGWNGKTFDPQTKAALHNQLDAMDISLKQKLLHKRELDINNVVPQIQKEVPYFIDYKARSHANNKQNY